MAKEEKMAGVDGIPITFTSHVAPGMKILVFGQNHDIVTEGDIAIAWKVWHSGYQMKVQFTYPYKTGVGAFYDQDNDKITIGPIVADPGTTWKYVTTSQTDPGELQLNSKSIEQCNQADDSSVYVARDGMIFYLLFPQ